MIVFEDLQLEHLDYPKGEVSQIVVYVLVVYLGFEVELPLAYR